MLIFVHAYGKGQIFTFNACSQCVHAILVHKKLCAAMMHNAKQGNNLKGQSCCFYFTIQILQQCV